MIKAKKHVSSIRTSKPSPKPSSIFKSEEKKSSSLLEGAQRTSLAELDG
jgi:hypothetical protein